MDCLFLESFGEVIGGTIGYGILFIIGIAVFGFILNALLSSAEKAGSKSKGGGAFLFWFFIVVMVIVFFFMAVKGCGDLGVNHGMYRHGD